MLAELRRDDFRTLKALETVNFSHNEIENVDSLTFADLKWLKELNLRNNRLNHLIDFWGDHPNILEALNLDDNLLTKV